MKRRKYSLANDDFSTAIYFDNRDYIINSFDLEQVDANLTYYAGAGQAGSTITHRQLGTRNCVIEGYVLAESDKEMRDKKSQLQKMVVPTHDFHVVIDDKWKMRLTALSSIAYQPEFFAHNEQLTWFSIEAVASNPFFEPLGEDDADVAGWVKDFHFPFSNPVGGKFTFAHREPSKIVKVANKGEIETGMKIIFTAINGTVVNPMVENVDTGKKLELKMTIKSGESVEISTTYGNKYVRNADTKENWLKYLSLQSDFLQMPIGISSFKYGYDENASTGTLKCVFRYTPKLFEV